MNKSPILLIHGSKTRAILFHQGPQRFEQKDPIPFDSSRINDHDFGEMPIWLNRDGFSVFFSQYDSNKNSCKSIEHQVKILQKHLLFLRKQSTTGKVLVIAHSLGGLIMRAYIDSPLYEKDRKKHGNFLEHVFLLGVPHAGTSYRYLMRLRLYPYKHDQFDGVITFSSRARMQKFNLKYPNKNRVEYSIICGTQCTSFYGHIFHAYTKIFFGDNDGVCPVESALSFHGKNVKKFLVQNSHEPFLGSSYFSSKDGKESDAYRHYIQPSLFHKKVRQRSLKSPIHDSLLSYFVMFIAAGIVHAMFFIRWIYQKIRFAD